MLYEVITQLATDILNFDGAAFVGEGRIASDHEEASNPRQRRGDRLDNAIGKKFLIGVASYNFV